MSKLIYYVAATMDGFIATERHTLEWLENFPVGDDATPYHDFYKNIGAVIMGRETYHWILANSHGEWPYSKVPNFVMTRQNLTQPASPGITLLCEDVGMIARRAKIAAAGKDVWLVGGGKTAACFADAGELNQLFITTIPVFIGRGVALLPVNKEIKTVLTSHRVLRSGVVESIAVIEPVYTQSSC